MEDRPPWDQEQKDPEDMKAQATWRAYYDRRTRLVQEGVQERTNLLGEASQTTTFLSKILAGSRSEIKVINLATICSHLSTTIHCILVSFSMSNFM